MVVVDFCATNNNFECVIEGALGIVPVAAFLFFGYYSYKETRARTAYLRQSYTFRHLSKIILSGVLAVVSFTFVALYTILESEISLKTELTWGVSCLLWLLNTFLLRSEYKTLGFTTNFLRYAWITMFVCQTGLLIFAAAGANTDSFEKVAAIYVINDVAILAIIIVGYSYADDFPKTRVQEVYGTLLSNDSIVDIGEDHFRNITSPMDRPTRTKEDATFKPFSADVPETQRDLPVPRRFAGSFDSEGSIEGDDRRQRQGDKKNTSKMLASSSMQVNLKEDVKLIESIEVKTFEEIRRFDKPTIIYTINYVIKGQQFSTKRSYSEFVELRQEAKKEKGDVKLPKIPGKKKIGKTRDEESLGNRAEAFDKLLKVLASEKIALSKLAVFLQPTSALPYYGKGKKAVTEESKKEVNKASMSSSPSKADKNEVKAKVLDNPGGRAIIADYTQAEANRSQSLMVTSKYYIVETINAYEDESSTFYKFNIREKESGFEYNITKRYNDFKTFHDELKKSLSSNDRKAVPELPYKENVKGLAWRDNPKVVEFRKVALKTYLQAILNHIKLQNSPVVKNFVAPSNI